MCQREHLVVLRKKYAIQFVRTLSLNSSITVIEFSFSTQTPNAEMAFLNCTAKNANGFAARPAA